MVFVGRGRPLGQVYTKISEVLAALPLIHLIVGIARAYFRVLGHVANVKTIRCYQSAERALRALDVEGARMVYQITATATADDGRKDSQSGAGLDNCNHAFLAVDRSGNLRWW